MHLYGICVKVQLSRYRSRTERVLTLILNHGIMREMEEMELGAFGNFGNLKNNPLKEERSLLLEDKEH